MMRIRGNGLGLLMFVVAGVLAGVGGLILNLEDAPVMIMVGLALFLMDFIIRLFAREQEKWLTASHLGGYLFIAPVWVIGIFVIVLNIINGLQLAS